MVEKRERNRRLFKREEHERRNVATEKISVTPGNSSAKSSKKALYYHDIPPELFRRTALRYTVGHTKHNDDPVPITMNLNWRIGLDDPLYVMDRLNHMFEHMVDFLRQGNEFDDNLGAVVWCAGFLMEVERMNPIILEQVLCQCTYSGRKAKEKKEQLQKSVLLQQLDEDTAESELIDVVKKRRRK